MLRKTLFIFGALLACSYLASADTIYLSPSPCCRSEQTVYVGSLVSFDFVTNATGFTGFDFGVIYAPLIMTLDSVTEEGFWATNGSGLSPDTTTFPGWVSFLFDTTSIPAGDTDPSPASILQLTFLITNPGSGSVQANCDFGGDCVDFPTFVDANNNATVPDQFGYVVLDAQPAQTPEPAFGIPIGCAALFLLWRRRRVTRSSPA